MESNDLYCHQCNRLLTPQEEVLLGDFCYCHRCSQDLLTQLPTEPHVPYTNHLHVLFPPYHSVNFCKNCTYAKKNICNAYLTTDGKPVKQSDARENQPYCKSFREKFHLWPFVVAFVVFIAVYLLSI